jgi:membrane-associated protease RseP (regulator of RpoE activity)
VINEAGGVILPGAAHDTARAVDGASALRLTLRDAVERVFQVEIEHEVLPAPITATYLGHFFPGVDSHSAFAQLDRAFAPLGHIPIFRVEGERQAIRAVRRYAPPRPLPAWPNVLLFILTILSLLYTGASLELGRLALPSPLDLLRGWPYALGLLLILGAHELGHYFAARHHRVAVSLPFFIPLPLPGTFGTLGAFIALREPIRDRRALLDVGAAGPLVGLMFAVPILFVGLRTSPVRTLPVLDLFRLRPGPVSYAIEGHSLLYAGLKYVAFGRTLPDGLQDVYLNQLAQAGWTGLLVTALNLLPVGQLDGGHALFALLGERARSVFLPFILGLGLLSLFYVGWLVWVFLLLALGRGYAAPLDMITPLDPRRRAIALLTLVVWAVVFTPVPVYIVAIGG